jgi:hypothetical protein
MLGSKDHGRALAAPTIDRQRFDGFEAVHENGKSQPMTHSLSTRNQFLVAAVLALFMAITRSPQMPGGELLHSGSWAAFFAAGVYLNAALALPAFLALAFVLDGIALGWAGIGAYCLTPAYAMLLPAYAALFAAGRWYASQHRFAWRTLAPLAASVLVGALACEAFSSGGFYWLSGRFAEPTLGEFVLREAQYFPAYLATMAFWVAATAVGHAALVTLHGHDTIADDTPA